MSEARSHNDLAAGFRAKAVGDYGSATANRNLPQSQADGLAASRSDTSKSWDGKSATYRLGFAGMAIKGLPDKLSCGRVSIHQTSGPIQTQSTYIIQRPGWIPRFDKTMHRGPVLVGDGLILTICQLPVQIPNDVHVALSFDSWRDEVLATVGAVVAMLDDRIAQHEVLEDLVIESGAQAEISAMMDRARKVRDYSPTNAATSIQQVGFTKLASWASDGQTATHVAARWYLRGAQAGPTPDAIVHFWIALEALVSPRSKGNTNDVKDVEAAIRDAGSDPSSWTPSIGRCAGLRGKIVHEGEDQVAGLYEGFYALEAAVRIVLRHRLKVSNESWPPEVGRSNLKPTFRRLAERLQRSPRTTMRWVKDDDS